MVIFDIIAAAYKVNRSETLERANGPELHAKSDISPRM